MGYYNQGLKIDPSLVAMTGGIGKGMAAFGDSLVDLGEDKIKKAEKDAEDKEKAAKKAALIKYNKTYGDQEKVKNFTDEELSYLDIPEYKSPTVSSTTTDSENNIITIMNNGSTNNTGVKGKKQYQKVGDNLVDLDTKQPVYTAKKPAKAPTQSTYQDPVTGKNMIKEWDAKNGIWKKTGELAPVYNQSATTTKTKGLKTTGGLSGEQIMFARDNNLTTKVDGKEYVSEEAYKKLLEMDKIGNKEVR